MAGWIIRNLSLFCALWALAVGPYFSVLGNQATTLSLSENDVQSLASELAPKVDLFSAVWAIDPEAEFFAGTTRDYIYWIISQFKGLTSREAIGEKIQELRDRPFIKISEMVGPDSDADVMTQKGFSNFSSINLSAFSIRKLDFVSFDRVNPEHPLGKTEIDQGFIPLEKLRLSKNGIMTHHVFGNGLRDIIDGTISIHFGHEATFWNTFYAKSDANHPVLLAVRYLRVVAQDYLHRYGNDFPDRQKLLGLISFSDQQKIKSIVRAAVGDPRFEKFLDNPRGRNWLNMSLQKSFRSFTNPTAAFELMKEMGVVDLVQAYPDKIESIFSYLLKIPDRKKEADELLQSYGYSHDEIFQNPERYLKNLELYHGAGSEKAFRSLIFQGVLPSEYGSAGRGFYATDSDNIEFAKSWSKNKSGSDTNVVALKIKPTTRLIDISKGSGQKLFAAWKLKNLNRTIDDFAFDFQADLIAYPYSASNLKSPFAFVLKNAAAVESRRGVLKFPKPIRDLITLARRVTTDTIFEFTLNLDATPMTDSEMIRLLALVPEKSIAHLLDNHNTAEIFKALPNSVIKLITNIIISLQNRPHSAGLKTQATRALLNQLFNRDFHNAIVERLIDFRSSWMESVSPRELALIKFRHRFNPLSARMANLISQISTHLKDHQRDVSDEHYRSAVEFLQDPLPTMSKENGTNPNDFLSEFYRRSKRLLSDIGIDYIGDINSEIAPFLVRGHFQIIANLDAKNFSDLSPYYLDLTIRYITSPNSDDTSVALTSARDTILRKFGQFLVQRDKLKNFMLQLTNEITGNLDFLYGLLIPLTESPIDLEFLKPKILQELSNNWSTIPEALLIELLKIADKIKIPLAEKFRKGFIDLLTRKIHPNYLSLLIGILRSSPQFNEIDFQMALFQSVQHVSLEDMHKIFNTELTPKFNQKETEELRKSILSNIHNLSNTALEKLISFYHQYFHRSLEEDTRHLHGLVRLQLIKSELEQHEWHYSKFTKDLIDEVYSYLSGPEFDRAKSILAKVKSPSFDFIKKISEFAQKQFISHQSNLIPLIVHLAYKASPPYLAKPFKTF